MRSFHSSPGQNSPLGMERSTIRYEREEKNKVRHGCVVCALFWPEFGEFSCRMEDKKGAKSVMDEKFALLFWSEFSIGNGEFHYQVQKRRKGIESVMDENFALLFWSEFSVRKQRSTIRYGREEK